METEVPIKYYRIVTKNGKETPLGTANQTSICIQNQILHVRAGKRLFEKLSLKPRMLGLRKSGANVRFETPERKFQAHFESPQTAQDFLAHLEPFRNPLDQSEEPVPPSQAETQASQRDLDQLCCPGSAAEPGRPTTEDIRSVLQNPQFPGEVFFHLKHSFVLSKVASVLSHYRTRKPYLARIKGLVPPSRAFVVVPQRQSSAKQSGQ